MAQPPLGSGGRFANLVASGKSPALAAWIGRKKYGPQKFEELSEHGRGHAAHRSGTFHEGIMAKAKKRAFTGNHMLPGTGAGYSVGG